ncbi:MAG: helix-turn-helix domain-containing protein [Verrucomicrobiota bacterium]
MKKSEMRALGRQAAAVSRGEKCAARVTRIEILPDGRVDETPVNAEKFRKQQATAWEAKTEAARIRQRLGMSQPEFAGLLGIPVATLRKWEIGPTQPSGAARTLLLLAAENPELVRAAAGRAMGAT